jgi:adenine-specific DNA-methyltransferase
MPTLNWIGKEAVINHHDEVPIHTLTHDYDRSFGSDNEPLGTGNLLIEGDNLIALKALLPYYAGKVKCIIIDPPYNTGNESWIYDDNVNNPTIQKWLGKTVGTLAADLSRHDKWLCMMYPRLCLLHQLLREDGVIFISIDDNEVHHLHLLMNEIFGETNFVANLIWRKKAGGGQDSEYYAREHEYILCYRKSEAYAMKFRTLQRAQSEFPKVKNGRKCKFVKLEKWGSNAHREDRPTMFYPIEDPDGNPFFPQAPDGNDGNWRTRPTALDQDHIHWIKRSGRWTPYEVIYFDEVEDTAKIVKERSIYYDIATTTDATNEQKAIFGKKAFDNSKPLDLIKRLILLSTEPDSIVLDSFAGSGTTGHAVLAQNSEDRGNRQFILIELKPEIALKTTSVRLKRISQGYTVESNGRQQHVFGINGTFSYYHVGETFLEKREIPFSEMAQLLFFKETGTPMAVDIALSLVDTDRTSYTSCTTDERRQRAFLGIADGVGVYLLNSDDILTEGLIKRLPRHDGRKIIHCGGTQLTEATLKQLGITFRQMPYNLV